MPLGPTSNRSLHKNRPNYEAFSYCSGVLVSCVVLPGPGLSWCGVPITYSWVVAPPEIISSLLQDVQDAYPDTYHIVSPASCGWAPLFCRICGDSFSVLFPRHSRYGGSAFL